jgi:acyl-CoA thioester hydrolase
VDGYPFVCPVQVRWRDLDAFGHVNNAVFATYLETARAELWRQRFAGAGAEDIPFVVARLEIEYRRPLGLYATVAVGVRVAEVRASSFTFEYRVEDAGALAASARTVQVVVSKDTWRAVRVPEELRQALLALT